MKAHYYRFLVPIAFDTMLSMAWHLGWDETSESRIYYAAMNLRAVFALLFILFATLRRWRPGKYVLIAYTWFGIVSAWDIIDTLCNGNVAPAWAELTIFVAVLASISFIRTRWPDKML